MGSDLSTESTRLIFSNTASFFQGPYSTCMGNISQYSALSISRGIFSPKSYKQTFHNSPVTQFLVFYDYGNEMVHHDNVPKNFMSNRNFWWTHIIYWLEWKTVILGIELRNRETKMIHPCRTFNVTTPSVENTLQEFINSVRLFPCIFLWAIQHAAQRINVITRRERKQLVVSSEIEIILYHWSYLHPVDKTVLSLRWEFCYRDIWKSGHDQSSIFAW